MLWSAKGLILLGYAILQIDCVIAQVPPVLSAAPSPSNAPNFNGNENVVTVFEHAPGGSDVTKPQDIPTTVTVAALPESGQQGSNIVATVTSVVDATTTNIVHVTPQVGQNGNTNMVVVGGGQQYNNPITMTVTSTQYNDRFVPGPTSISYVFATITATVYPPPRVVVVPVTNAVYQIKTVTKHITVGANQPMIPTAMPTMINTAQMVPTATTSISQLPTTVTATTSVATTEIVTTTDISTATETPPSPLPTIDSNTIVEADNPDFKTYRGSYASLEPVIKPSIATRYRGSYASLEKLLEPTI
ncbi:hypothetical protein H4R24_005037, partial [Coemansia sp. RSA 988]